MESAERSLQRIREQLETLNALTAAQVLAYRTFEDLDAILAILGSTKTTFWPFLESRGQIVRSYREAEHNLTPSDEAAARNLEDEFEPFKHPSGIFSYYNVAGANNHLRGVDHADFSFGDGSTDEPFSVGIWLLLRGTVTATGLSKHRVEAVTQQEWRLSLLPSGVIESVIFDESANAGWVARSATAMSREAWNFIVATYDGNESSPGIQVYANGLPDLDTLVESGSYVAMENGTTPLLVGALNITTNPTQEVDGRLALPFICGKELSASEVSQLYTIGKRLLGLTA